MTTNIFKNQRAVGNGSEGPFGFFDLHSHALRCMLLARYIKLAVFVGSIRSNFCALLEENPGCETDEFPPRGYFNMSDAERESDGSVGDQDEESFCFNIRRRLERVFGSDDEGEDSEDDSSNEDGRCTWRPKRSRLHTHVYVVPEHLPQSLDKKFVSVAMGAFITRRLNKSQFDTTSVRLQTLAAALAPCTLRFGGNRMLMQLFSADGGKEGLVKPSTEEEFERTFGVSFWDGKVGRSKNLDRYLLTGEQWDELYAFVFKAGWDIVYNFNNMLYTDGVWDSTNASHFLKYSSEKGYEIEGFHLGNEPNYQGINFAVGVTAKDLARDTQAMRDLIHSFPLYKDSKIVGPEVTKSGLSKYFADFLNAGGEDAVHYASFHHYYYDGRKASQEDCVSVPMFNKFKMHVEKAAHMIKRHSPGKPIWLTETGSFFGGGTPGLSDRFAGGFLWLDKLGLCAKTGLDRVYRQTFYGGHYTMVDNKTYFPNPDFFLTLLYKKLIEGPVFEVTFSPNIEKLRLYANKARTDSEYNYPEGSLVLYYVNAHRKSITLELIQFQDRKIDLFILTSGHGGLVSRFAKLNGKKLEMPSENELPKMEPKSHEGEVRVPGHSFGFIVVPNAGCPHFQDKDCEHEH